jgi:conjugal transfer/entry exclusion protein
MNPYRHPHWATAREDQAEAFREDIERFLAAQENRPRQGVRVLPDGTIERYSN